MSKSIKVILSAIAILLISGAVFWSVKNENERRQKEAEKISSENQSQQIAQQENTQNSEEQIDTSDWKTYRNEEYEFEFKYPPFFYLDDRSNTLGGSVNFLNKDKSGSLLFSISFMSEQRSKVSKNSSCVKINKDKVTFDDIIFSRMTSSPTSQSSGDESFCFKKGSTYFDLNFWFGNLTEKNNITKYEKDIIDTFRFIQS